MFLIRTAFWLGIIVMIMPSDPEAQARLKMAVRDGVSHAATICERQPQACERASAAWSTFKVKAEVAGRFAFDLAMEQMAGRAKSADAAPAALPAPAASARPAREAVSTLRPEDQAPRWRSASAGERN